MLSDNAIKVYATTPEITEIQVGPVQRIDLPPLYVKDSHVFGLKGAFLAAKDALYK